MLIPERRRRVLRQYYYHRRVLVLLLRPRNKVAVFSLEVHVVSTPEESMCNQIRLETYVHSIHEPEGDAVNTCCTQGRDGER